MIRIETIRFWSRKGQTLGPESFWFPSAGQLSRKKSTCTGFHLFFFLVLLLLMGNSFCTLFDSFCWAGHPVCWSAHASHIVPDSRSLFDRCRTAAGALCSLFWFFSSIKKYQDTIWFSILFCSVVILPVSFNLLACPAERERTRWGENWKKTFLIMSGIRCCCWMGGYRSGGLEGGEMIAKRKREEKFLGCDLHNGLGALVRPLGACHVHGPDWQRVICLPADMKTFYLFSFIFFFFFFFLLSPLLVNRIARLAVVVWFLFAWATHALSVWFVLARLLSCRVSF